MLAGCVVDAMVPTKDLKWVRAFYEGALGLKERKEAAVEMPYDCSGGSWLFLYQTMIDVTPEPTVACWSVGDIQVEVANFQSRGVQFQEYDFPNTTKEGSIYDFAEVGKGAWFKDPDGNVLQLFQPASSA